MDVKFTKGRVIVAPFTANNDIDPISKKPGIHIHHKILGRILSLIGKAQEMNGYDIENKKTVSFYINTQSATEWVHRHGFPKVDPLYDPVPFHSPDLQMAISQVSEIAKLSKEMIHHPNNYDLWLKRGNFYMVHENLFSAIRDFSKALELAQTEKERVICLFNRAECFRFQNNLNSFKKAEKDYEELEKIDPHLANPKKNFDLTPLQYLQIVRKRIEFIQNHPEIEEMITFGKGDRAFFSPFSAEVDTGVKT